MLTVDELAFEAGSRQILAPTTFSIDPGTAVAVIGPNGAGKSTLLRIICGFLTPTSGTYRRGADLVWVPQRGPIEPMLTVNEYLRVASRSLEGLTLANVSTELERLGFARCSSEQPLMSLSGGERRKIQLAMALARTEAALLVLDEPTAPLDRESSERFWEGVELRVAKGAGVAFVSHSGAETTRADDVVRLGSSEHPVSGAR